MKIKLDKENIELVEDYIYLGIKITEHGKNDQDIKNNKE